MKNLILTASVLSLFLFSCKKNSDEPTPQSVAKVETERDYIRAKLSTGEEYVVYGTNIDGTQIADGNGGGTTTKGVYVGFTFNDIDYSKVVTGYNYNLYSKTYKEPTTLTSVKIVDNTNEILYFHGKYTPYPEVEKDYDVNKYYHTFIKIDKQFVGKGIVRKIYGYISVPGKNGVNVELFYMVTDITFLD